MSNSERMFKSLFFLVVIGITLYFLVFGPLYFWYQSSTDDSRGITEARKAASSEYSARAMKGMAEDSAMEECWSKSRNTSTSSPSKYLAIRNQCAAMWQHIKDSQPAQKHLQELLKKYGKDNGCQLHECLFVQ